MWRGESEKGLSVYISKEALRLISLLSLDVDIYFWYQKTDGNVSFIMVCVLIKKQKSYQQNVKYSLSKDTVIFYYCIIYIIIFSPPLCHCTFFYFQQEFTLKKCTGKSLQKMEETEDERAPLLEKQERLERKIKSKIKRVDAEVDDLLPRAGMLVIIK